MVVQWISGGVVAREARVRTPLMTGRPGVTYTLTGRPRLFLALFLWAGWVGVHVVFARAGWVGVEILSTKTGWAWVGARARPALSVVLVWATS